MASVVNMTAATSDSSFGPQLEGRFDFTLLFEQSIFTILPGSLLLCIAPLQVAHLFRTPARVRSGWLLWSKIAFGIALIAIEAASVGVWTTSPAHYRTASSIAAASLSLAVAVCIFTLAWAQHRHSLQLSSLLSIYLGITILLDAAQIRSLFRRPGLHAEASLFIASTVLKGCLLLLEEVSKRQFFHRQADNTASSPESSSGFWNRRLFVWVNSILFGGFRSILAVDNLQHLGSDFDSAALLHCLEDRWESGNKKSKNSLLRASAAVLAVPVLSVVLPRLLFVGFNLAQPFLLHTVVEAVGGSEISENTAGGLIGATVLIYLGIALSRGCYMHLTFRFITMLRGSLVSMILKKSLRLQSGTDAASAAVTHMSTDVDSIAQGLETLHDMWAAVVELGVGAYMMSRYVGAATFLVVIPAIVSSIGSGYLAAKLAPAKVAWNKKVEERVSTTSHCLAQLKGIKMMGLGPWAFEHIQNMRVIEMEYSKKYRTLVIAMYSTGQLTLSFAPILVIAGALFWTNLGNGLTPAQAFSTLSIIQLVSQPFSMLMMAFPILFSMGGCFTRIQDYLLLPERIEQRSGATMSSCIDRTTTLESESDDREHQLLNVAESEKSDEISMAGASFAFDTTSMPVLKNVNLNIPPSSFTVIIGAVGSGKTTLLKAILGEVGLCGGNMQVAHRSIAYCGQTSWLRNVSIRANVIGEGTFDQDWYNTVMDACLLNEDVKELSHGDESLAGNGGSNLSGGQKQRVALARAVYSRNRVVLLDDVFSALDRRTSDATFCNLLGEDGLLRRVQTTVVLATHNVEFAISADLAFKLEAGGTVSASAPNEISLNRDSGFQSSSQQDDAELKDRPVAGESETSETYPLAVPNMTAANEDDLDIQRQGGDLTLYRFYFKSVSNWAIAVWFVLATAYVLAYQMPNVWIRIWLATAPGNNLYFIGYVGWGVLALIMGFLALAFFMLKFVPESAENLHRTLLDVVMRQPLWYFTSMDSGSTLNRFSQDMTLVSQELPIAFFLVTFYALINLTTVAIIVSGASYAAAIIPVLVVMLYLLQSFYLRTSRQMRHMDLEAKTPLYTCFTEVSSGIEHIRAFNWQSAFMDRGLRLLDISQKPYYLLFCIQRWLTFVLDIIVLVIAVVLITLAVKTTSTTSKTAIGLALVNLVGYGESLAQLMQFWTNLETSLGAIARLRTYVDNTPVETDPEHPFQPPNDWPSSGNIEIQDLGAKYGNPDTSANAVLDGISIQIRPGQKVGIIGRTGSGKSSFMFCLLHLLDMSGSILIDGVDISRVTRQCLRSHITTITQDAVTLPGSVRTNLCPLPSAEPSASDNDEAIRAALLRVGLLDHIESRGGLDAGLSAMQFSAGEMQLFSLARAVLHNAITKSHVILIDEATSNMDRETEERAQQVFQSFSAAGCTMIVIAHRTDTIQDADVIVELGHGKVINIVERGA